MYRRKGRIKPIFIREPIGILDTLIEVFRDHPGKKRWQLNEVVSDCEHLGYDYKMVRGLASVLESRSIFQSRSSMSPLEARQQVFVEAASKVVSSKEERHQVLKTVAMRNSLTVEMLEDTLYADLEDEEYLIDFKELKSEDLMRYYNYANMISLLAYSSSLEIIFNGPDEYLVNLLKRFKSSNVTGRNRVKAVIEFKQTRRLSQRARIIDEIISLLISKPTWSLKALIKYPLRYKTICTFEIDSWNDGKLLAVDKSQNETIIEIGSSSKKESKYGDIIVVEEMANVLGVTSSQILEDIRKEGLTLKDLGGVLVSLDKYEEIDTNLKTLETLSEVRDYFKSLGVRDILVVLESFGYQVEWSKPRENSKIYRL
jgi:predicted nuclease of restriction endonuclease-like RecB superfamily